MNITIKATNTTLTDALRADVGDKLSVLEAFLKPEDKVHVELDVAPKGQNGEVFRAEISIQPRGYFAEARGADMYEAIDLVVPKIREQLIKQKDKKISLRNRLGSFFKRSS